MQHLWFSYTSPLIKVKAVVSCIIDVARRAEIELLCLHLPVVVFALSHILFTVSVGVHIFNRLSPNFDSRRDNKEDVCKVNYICQPLAHQKDNILLCVCEKGERETLPRD